MLAVLSVAPFGVAAVLTLITNAVMPAFGLGWSWVVSISLVSFGTYGYDKFVAGRDVTRVPEVVLHLLTVLSGTPGSFAGMQIFRHKTQKKPFQLVFWAIVVIQIFIIIVLMTRP